MPELYTTQEKVEAVAFALATVPAEIKKGGSDFMDVVTTCLGKRELLAQFNRLAGHSLRKPGRTGLDAAIDQATGREDAAMVDFVAFVKDMVWDRMPREAFAFEEDREGKNA